MWKDSIRNIVVIFQTTILRFVGFYVRHLASEYRSKHFLENCSMQFLSYPYPTSDNFFSFAEQNKTHIRAGINLLPSIIFSSQVASQGYLRLLLFRLDINLVLTLKEAGFQNCLLVRRLQRKQGALIFMSSFFFGLGKMKFL